MSYAKFQKMSVHERRLCASGFSHVAGIDEAGRGPLAGPVVAAACILPQGKIFCGLNDSKQLSPKQRESLYLELTTTEGVFFGIGQASVAEIDEKNILGATKLAMQRAVFNLPLTPDYLLIDGNQSPVFSIPKETIVQGDCLSVSIAAASILAKVFRDRLMHEMGKIWPVYRFEKHKGYGTREHLDILQKVGPCPLHRKAFID